MIINIRPLASPTMPPKLIGKRHIAHIAQGGRDLVTKRFDIFDESFGVEAVEVAEADERLEGYAAELGHCGEEGVEECGSAGLVVLVNARLIAHRKGTWSQTYLIIIVKAPCEVR